MNGIARQLVRCSPILVASLAFSAEFTKVKVASHRVNLRATATMKAEVVGQVNEDDTLLAKSFQGEWVEVVPPPDISLWVHSDFVDQNVVSGSRLNVRGGAGINYSIVGRLDKGQSVVTRGEFGDWMEIQPPESCSLWIHRDYVERIPVITPTRPPQHMSRPPERPVATPRTGGPVVPPARIPVKPEPPPESVRSPAPPPPKDLDLIPLKGQGKISEYEGLLTRAGFILGRPSKFRLVLYKGSTSHTLCYLKGNREQLTNLMGKNMRVRGREYWVQGGKYPVVVPEKITIRKSRRN